MKVSPTKLRQNVYRMLDHVLETGEAIEIERRGQVLKIVREKRVCKLSELKPMKNLINGDPALLDEIDWTDEWKP